MKSIIVFTVSYPYGSKEQFLETEIGYLSRFFKEVIIIPTTIHGEQRDVPENVRIDKDYSHKYSNIDFFLQAFSSKYLYKELLQYPFVLKSLTHIMKLFAFIGKGKCLYKHMKNLYGHEYIFYSYWLNGSVFGLYLYDTYTNPIKFCTRVHGSDVYLEVNKGYLPLRQVVLEKISKVFSISQNAKEYLCKNYVIDTEKIEVSRLGTRSPIKDTSASSGRDFHILSCSHISPVKQLDLLLKALDSVAKDNKDIQLSWTHIGSGPGLSKLKKLSKTLLNTNLEVNLVGNMNNDEVFRYYQTHTIDLFVNVSFSEGLPVSFMEAFSCAVPVLAINNGGVSEIINDENGILLKHDSSTQEIALHLSYWTRHKKELAMKKSSARRTWEKSYNADNNYTNFMKLLDNMNSDR